MASNFRRKSASSDSNRRASSRPDARRASGRARAPRDGAGDWRAIPGGRYSQQRPQQRQDDYEDLGPAFPSEASGMDDVPF